MGSIISHRIDYNGGRGSRRPAAHSQQKLTQVPLLYHLRKRMHVMNKIKNVRWSYVNRTLDFFAPWLGNTDIKALFLFERRICNIDNVNFFLICNCAFGIWLNFDAVLRYSRATMCGIAVFVPPLRPPLSRFSVRKSNSVTRVLLTLYTLPAYWVSWISARINSDRKF